MLRFQDFVPEQLRRHGVFGVGVYDTFEAAVEAAGRWISDNRITVLQIETVVLPNIWGEDGSTDPSLNDATPGSGWNQFIRIWHKIPEPPIDPYR